MDNSTIEQTRHAILLVEDDELDQQAFTRLVKDQELPYDYKVAGSVSEARGILGREGFDVIITDYSLGDGTAFDILDCVNNAPIIVITGTSGSVINALKNCVYQTMVKDMERNYLKVLPETVENAIRHEPKEDNK
jgi:DNA-binding NtrC family response regulator